MAQPSRTREYAATYARTRKREERARRAGSEPGARCELCGGPPGGRWNRLHFDHNHGTDAFRGWLCNKCNQTLGLAGDNPALLRRMADYLVERGFTVTRSVLR